MSTLPQTFVVITPRELKFENVKLNQTYIQTINLENTLSNPLNIEIKAGNAFRYKINEPTITLQSNESKNIDIQLKLTKSISTNSPKIKDFFYIKSAFFNEHISSIITMADNINDNNNNNNITSEIFEDNELEKENKHLRDYIVKLENNMSELKIELNYFDTIKSEINASMPDLETIVGATIGKERASNEVRNKKILHILQSKDEEIQKLKEINKNYQSIKTSLHFIQTKHVNLTQIFQETQNENIKLKNISNQYQQQIEKLNEKISSYAQQSQFEKKIVNERDLRIKELTNDIKETQDMLANNTKTMKTLCNQQLKELENKLNESNKTIKQITNELNEKDLKYKNDLISLHKMMEENRSLNTELQRLQIKKEIVTHNDNQQEQMNNKQIMDELARKSAHLSASKAIIQQQRNRIQELEQLQKLTNKSVFEQSIKLNESNKKLTNNSSENQRLLSIYKRQIEILNKKLSNSINNEEQINIKFQNLKKQLSVSETEYVDKIEELEQALIAVNNINSKTKIKKQPSKLVKNHKMVQFENKLIKTENKLQSVAKKLNYEMRQRQLDIKAHHIKLQNNKQLYDQQMNRLQSIIKEIQSKNNNNDNINRLIELNNKLAQSEKLKNEYLNEIQILNNALETHQHGTNNNNSNNNNNHNTEERDKILLALNETCSKQKEEICDLEEIMNAAIIELKKYNPDIIHKLKKTRSSSSISSNALAFDQNEIIQDDQINKIKQICDIEINRYQNLYENMDKEYQSYKKKMNQDILQKDECYLNELAQQKQQITKLQAEIAQFRKLHLNQQQKCQTLQIENQSLVTKLEQHSELELQTMSDIPHASGNILSENEALPILKIKKNDIKEMEEIITHQDAQIKVLMNTIETLQHHKPKKSQIVELTGRLAVHESLQSKRKKELQSIRSNWIKDQESKIILDKKCGNLKAKVKSLKFELKNIKQHNESICNQFENYQRQMIDKENKIHELELSQSRLQSIRKQLESRANIMQNEMDNLSKQHFQHLQTLSNEHQNQLKKLTDLHCNNISHVDTNNTNHKDNNEWAMNHSLQSNISNDFHNSLKCLSYLLEKYLIHQRQITDQQKKKMGLTTIEYSCLINGFKSNTLGSVTTIEDKHQFMKQLMNIVNQQYGNIISLQKQTNFYEWLSRHHYNRRKESETNVLSLQCQLQINKKHLKRVKNDIDHNQLIIQQQLQKRKDLIKQQMNKAIHKYLLLETQCTKLTSELNGSKKQCAHFESQYFFVLNQLNMKQIDISEKEMEFKQHISDELSMNSNERDKKLKDYLHDNLKNIIQETIRKFERNDLYENQIFELSNEMLSLKYVQNELTKQLEKALFDNQQDKNENKRLCKMIKDSNEFYEKMRKHQQINENDNKCKSDNNSTTQSPINYNKNMSSKHDINTMELEQELCDKKLENESLQNSINGLQKEGEELLEQININKIKHENELKNMREQIGREREILIQNHNSEIANNHQQHQHKMQKLQIEMEHVCQKVRPWTDSLDLNQLKQTVESQTHELSRSNIHLQTLRTKITQLEYQLSDNEKEMESNKFVIHHLQDTIKLFGINNDESECPKKPSTKLIISTLCQELIKARRAQSNAMIKLRVSSNSEIELQETISPREKRINQLKQYLNIEQASTIKGQVIDITKNDRKIDELILQIASKDAEVRYLKKKLSIEQTKITVVYDIKVLQELVEKIDVYYHNSFGTKVPYKPNKVHLITRDNSELESLQNEINTLKEENKKLKEYEILDISNVNNKTQQDRLGMTQSKNKLNYCIHELNEYISKIKSVCNVSFGKSSQRTTLKLKKIEDLCKLQHIKIRACSDQINNLLMNVIQNIDIFDREYQGLQLAHQRLQQHIADEKTKYVEMEQELLSIRTTLNTYKCAEKRRHNVQDHSMQTDTITIDFDTHIKIKSLQNTIKSLQKSQNLETQDWRDDIVSLHEQLLQSKIDINRYRKECKELQNMYLELKSQIKSKNKRKSTPSSEIILSDHHQLRLAAIQRKRKIASLQRQLNEATDKWKQSEIKYQKLLSDNIQLQKKSESLSMTVNEVNQNKKEKLSEMHSMCNKLQCDYEKQSEQFMKLKQKNNMLKHKNDELNQKTVTTERRSDKETCKIREQLISVQCENKKEREFAKELQDKIVQYRTDINKIKCDKDADIQLKNKNYKSKVRNLHNTFDKNISDKNQQIKQLEQLYEEEQKHHTQHFNKLMQQFDEYKDTQTRIQKMYEMQLNLLKKRFENAIIAEQERLSLVNECQSVKSMKSYASNTNSLRSRTLRKSQSNSRICVSDYSDLLYDLSQRDSALKSLKNELKSLKIKLKHKEREYQKLSIKEKKHSRVVSSQNNDNKNQTNSLFEVRASAVWSARLTHCTIQITEFKKKLTFEQEIGILKDEDIENYKFEIKQLKLQISNVNKKLENQINIKSKKCIHFESEITNWKIKEKGWEEEKDKLNQDIMQLKKTIKKSRQDINRKEYILKQFKQENETNKTKLEAIKLKRKSMHFYNSDKYKELNKEIETNKNKLGIKENLLSDLKKKYQKFQNNFDKIQLNNHELQSKNRSANSEISRKEILINELKNKLQNIERENISNKADIELILKLKQKCKHLKSNENRKDELWRGNKQRLEIVTKELNLLKQQNSQKRLKMVTKLNKIQNDEEYISKKYCKIKNESLELKTIIDTLYNKLSVINNDLISTLNDIQKNYYKNNKNKNNDNTTMQYDDTVKAAQIVDGFTVNGLEEIMHCKKKKKQCYDTISNHSNPQKTILWDKYEEKTIVIQLFEKIIHERIRLEIMIYKLKMHQNNTSNNDNLQNDQFEKIKIKHQQHINEYQTMLNKFRKHQ